MNKPYDPNVTTDHVVSNSAKALQTTDQVCASARQEGSPPRANAPLNDLPEVPGYRVLREIARGGMGRVLVAFDLTLDRDVALKVLLPSASAERFVRESKITARLPHPGIPPVHALGTLADGSPFLAMKLIAGRTLADEIASADRQRLLQAFVQICQAVGFAHSRGIIHRDLKPVNVMVGAFGEVQVMDWGLAKDLANPETISERQTARASSRVVDNTDPGATTSLDVVGESFDERTQAGQVLGTPAYMAPEQARGEPTDARSDVFALGGILCAILTGQPPYSGKSSMEVIRRAGAADLSEASRRLDQCGADAELIALCRHCLNPKPAERPANGQAVADCMTTHLDGVQQRLRTAERERAVAVAREVEQRKRRRVQLALAVALIGLLLGGGMFAWWQDHQANMQKASEARLAGERDAEERNRRNQAQQSIDANLTLAAQLRKEHRFEEASLALAQAERLARESKLDRVTEVEQAIKELAFVVELDRIRFRKWIWVAGGKNSQGQFSLANAPPEYQRAFAGHGLDISSLPPDETASRIAASAVKAEMIAALDDWALHESELGLRDRLLEVTRLADPDPWTDQLRDPVAWDDRKAVERLAAEVDPTEAEAGALIMLSDLMMRHPPISGARLEDLGLLNPLPLLVKAHTARPDNFELAFWLAMLQTELRMKNLRPKNFDQIATYEAARALRPKNVAVWVNLGQELAERGDVDEAITCLRRAIALDRTAAVAHFNLGGLLMEQGKAEDAIACYQEAIAASPNFAEAYVNLGILLRNQGKDKQGIDCYHEAIRANPKLREAHFNLAVALADAGEVDKSIDSYQEVLKLDPNDARCHNNLGNSLRRKGKTDESIVSYQKAISLDPNFALAHSNLGEVWMQRRNLNEAVACFDRAVALDPKLAIAHYNLGQALYVKKDAVEAVAWLEKAVALDPDDAHAYYFLGLALDLADRQKEAVQAWMTAARLNPGLADSHRWLSKALLLQGRPSEALVPLGELGKHLPAETARTWGVPDMLTQAKRFSALEKRLPGLVEGKDSFADNQERLDASELCRRQGRFASAAKFFAEAFALDPKLADDLEAGHRYNAARSAAVAAAGQGEDTAKLDDEEQARLRKQVVDWLNADLVQRRTQLENGAPADQAAMRGIAQRWLSDRAFASVRDSAVLAKLPTEELQTFTRFWAEVAEGDIGPFVERVAAMPPDDQVKEIGEELKRRNPGFDGILAPTIENDVVVGLNFKTDHIKDISPVRALTQLRKLELEGSGGNKGALEDLTPLWGMRLTFLSISGNPGVKDLSAIEGMPLTSLNIGSTAVTDLTPLRGMPLEWLFAWAGFRGSDLAPLRGMPLKWLNCGGGGQKLDLTPLAGLPLEFLCFNITRTSDLTPLSDVPLKELHASNTLVADLTALRGMRLQKLYLVNSKVSDLAPLQGMPLNDLDFQGAPVSSQQTLRLYGEILDARKAKLGPDHPDTLALSDRMALRYLTIAAEQAWFAQHKELAETCEKALLLAGDTNYDFLAEKAAKTCVLRSLPEQHREKVLTLARRAVKLGERNAYFSYFQMTQGMAEYRAGHFAEAETALASAMKASEDNPHVKTTAAFYRAMSLFRQGNEELARTLFSEAMAGMKPLPRDEKRPLADGASHDDLILWLAFKEAKALIDLEATSTAQE